jgi:hypothetical protein
MVLGRLAICMYRLVIFGRIDWRSPEKAGRPERVSTRTAQFFWKRLCQTNLLQALPAGASRVASILAALLIELKGVLNSKVQVKTRRDVTL